MTPLRSDRSRATLGYPEALAALESRGRFGIHLGLSRTRALLAALGHPERSFRGALIAGTNGKGSVLALVGAALQAAGYRTGETPKPHLVTYRERLQIGGIPVDPKTFARVAGEVLGLADRVARRQHLPGEAGEGLPINREAIDLEPLAVRDQVRLGSLAVPVSRGLKRRADERQDAALPIRARDQRAPERALGVPKSRQQGARS